MLDMGVLEGEFSAFRVLWSPRFTGRGWPLPLAGLRLAGGQADGRPPRGLDFRLRQEQPGMFALFPGICEAAGGLGGGAVSSPRPAPGQSAVLVPRSDGEGRGGRDELRPGPAPAPCPSPLMSPGAPSRGEPGLGRRQSQSWSAAGVSQAHRCLPPSLIPQMLLCHLSGKWVRSWPGRGLPRHRLGDTGRRPGARAQIP